MKWYGSVTNRIDESRTQPEPVVGMGVTEYLWSDREPYEIIEVKTPKRIVIRKLDYRRTDKNYASEWQDYEFTSNPNNSTKILFKNKHGQWKEVKHSKGSTFGLGVADCYYDYSF